MCFEFEHNMEATEDLVQLCRNSEDHPDAFLVASCLERGAYIFAQFPGRFLPIIHSFTLLGLEDCLEVCLQVKYPIDFTQTRNKWNFTVFHCISEENSPEVSARVLRLLIRRIEEHPDDLVDWGAKDNEGYDCIGLVAHFQQLSVLWGLFKRIPFFSTLSAPLLLSSVWEHDWESLGEERKHFQLLEDLIRANPATRALAFVSKKSLYSADPKVVEEYVKDGADVLFWDPDMNRPLLHHFVATGQVECVRLCLMSELMLDLTKGDNYGWTPLHYVCVLRNSNEDTIKMLEYFVERVESHPGDKVSWGQMSNDNYDFLSCAAKYQKLSVVWPIVREVPYFADLLHFIELTKSVWKYDWEALGDQQKNFVASSGQIEADLPTGWLVQDCERWEWRPDPEIVLKWSLQGADICFSHKEMSKPILHHFVSSGQVRCVESCLKTTRSIDFTTSAEYGWTPLHYTPRHENKEITVELVKLFISRLASNLGDVIDWFQQDDDGNDFISYAAYYHKLTSIWPLIKNIAAFRSRIELGESIFLLMPVPEDEWSSLDEDQRWFTLKKGFRRNIVAAS